MDNVLLVIVWLTAVINVIILVSSIDDVFIDAYYWIRQGIRALTVQRKYPRLRLEQLRSKPESPFAIMIPAWKEYSVIAMMVENAIAALEYKKYVIFIGTYRNDPETGAEADRLTRKFPNVRHVTLPHGGPTCKADCLNWVIKDVFRYEQETGQAFAGLVMHDAEDVIHPLELRLFNFLTERKDLIQLPVLSLERDWSQWVAGTYQDDFGEWHSKDLVVRESMTGHVPCAGVGTCFSRRAMAALCAQTGDAPFNTDTLTEDYDFSFRLKQLGMSQVFVKVPVEYPTTVKRLFGGTKQVVRHALIGVREYFPDTFRTAYRQRARWILGIGMQGWQILGWKGTLGQRYLLFRDRKCLFTSLVNVLALALFFALAPFYLFHPHWLAALRLPEAMQANGWVMRIMEINGIFMVNRCVQRFIFVGRLFGPFQGLLALPRILVGNFVNFAATVRAWRLFLQHLASGKPLAWDKTAHAYPSDRELRPFRKKLGEILLAWKEIDQSGLDQALAEQRTLAMPLGQLLLRRNLVNEAVLADAVAQQSGMPRSTVDLESLARYQTRIPRALAIQLEVVPLGMGELGEELVGCAAAPSDAVRAALAGVLSRKPRFFIITETELVMALGFLAGGAAAAAPAPAGAGREVEAFSEV
jgi:adsorption protein B